MPGLSPELSDTLLKCLSKPLSLAACTSGITNTLKHRLWERPESIQRYGQIPCRRTANQSPSNVFFLPKSGLFIKALKPSPATKARVAIRCKLHRSSASHESIGLPANIGKWEKRQQSLLTIRIFQCYNLPHFHPPLLPHGNHVHLQAPPG